MLFLDYLLHLDTYLSSLISFFGPWSYLMLFAIVFAETGLVITPFLPGDSLLFAVGAIAGSEYLNPVLTYVTLLLAAIIGDTVNYWIGQHVGPHVFTRTDSRFFNKAYLDRTHSFFEKYGPKAVVLGRFVPIVRTFVPFVAGIGSMRYSVFLSYNVIGAIVWVTLIGGAGYFFGGISVVKNNFEWVVLGIIFVSILPMVVEYVRHRRPLTNDNVHHLL